MTRTPNSKMKLGEEHTTRRPPSRTRRRCIRLAPIVQYSPLLPPVGGRASYGGERIGVTKNGRLTAIVIGVEDLLALEELEDARDLAAFREAVRNDDGQRVSLSDLRAELND